MFFFKIFENTFFTEYFQTIVSEVNCFQVFSTSEAVVFSKIFSNISEAFVHRIGLLLKWENVDKEFYQGIITINLIYPCFFG